MLAAGAVLALDSHPTPWILHHLIVQPFVSVVVPPLGNHATLPSEKTLQSILQ